MGLQDLDDLYDKTEAAVSKGPLPDGNYEAHLDRIELTQSSNGNDMLVFEVIIDEGDFAGRHHTFNRVITEQTLSYVKSDLKVFGYTGKLSALEDQNNLTPFLDKKLQVAIRSKGQTVVNGKTYDNKNTYINPPKGAKPAAAPARQAPAPAPAREVQAVVDPPAAPAVTPPPAANSRTGGITKRTVVKGPRGGGDEPPF